MKKILIVLILLLGALTAIHKGPSKKEPISKNNYCTMRDRCDTPDCWPM